MRNTRIIRGCLVVACASLLTACNAVNSMNEAYDNSTDVAADLEKSVGSKPVVGFDLNNGELTSVSVTFDGIPQHASLQDIAEKSRQAIISEFKKKPEEIVISFSVAP